MELRQLEYFRIVAELSNFTKAAEQLHVSQPSITTSIKNLETELGIRLFVRDTRKVMLTYEGKQFLGRIEPVLRELHGCVEEAKKQAGEYENILNIGVTPVSGAPLVAALFGDFSGSFPEIGLQVMEMGSHGILKAIDQGEIDLGYMVILDGMYGNYEVSVIERDRLLVTMHRAHPLASGSSVHVRQLKDVPVIGLPVHTFISTKMNESFALFGVEPNVLIRPQQMFTVFNLIQSNLGVTFTLGRNYASVMRTDELISLPLEPEIPYEIGFVWKQSTRLNEASRKCIHFIQEKRK